MTENLLQRILEHNLWATQQLIDACRALTEEQLNAPPTSVTKGTIHETLTHLAGSQMWYLSLLTGTPRKYTWDANAPLDEIEDGARVSGEALVALARAADEFDFTEVYSSENGHSFNKWVVMVQLINHADEHREQIKSMISAFGIEPPSVDGWSFGVHTGALTLPSGR